MPKTPLPAAAIGLPEISRRTFLRQTAIVGTAVAVPVAAVAAPAMHPIERLHELHEEASALMVHHNEHMGGEWELRIRAPHDRCPVAYMSLGAVSPLERVKQAKADLVRAYKAAYPDTEIWNVLSEDEPAPGTVQQLFMVVGKTPRKGGPA